MHASVQARARRVDELMKHDRLHGAIETSLFGRIDEKCGHRRGRGGVLCASPQQVGMRDQRIQYSNEYRWGENDVSQQWI